MPNILVLSYCDANYLYKVIKIPESIRKYSTTVMPTKSDSDLILCLKLQSKNNLYTPLDLTRIDRSLVY